MAVFRYTALAKGTEEHSESGTVVARDEKEARQKLKRLNLNALRVKKLGGLSGFLKTFTANVR